MRTARIVALKGVADVAARAAGLLTFPVLAAQAGAAGYGAYALVTTLASFVVPFASLGLGSAMVRFVGRQVGAADADRQFLAVLRVSGTGAAVAGLALVALAGPLADLLLDWPGAVALLRYGGLLMAASTLEQVVLEYLRARERLLLYVGYQFTQTVTTVVAVLTVMLWRADVVLLVAVLGAVKALTVAVTVLLARRPDPAEATPPTGGPDAATDPTPGLLPMLRFGLPMTVAGFGLWLVNLSDRLVIGHYLPADALGRYSAVFVFASLLTLVAAPLFLPAYPRMMAAASTGQVAPQTAEIRLFHRWIALLTIPAAGLLCLTIGPLALITGGRAFDVPQSLVVLMVLALLLDQWNGLAHYVLLCHGRSLFLQNAWLGYGTANLLVSLAVVPRYGLTGAAAVTLATFLLLETHVLLAAQRLLPVVTSYRLRTTSLAVGAAAAAAAVALPVVRLQDGSLLAVGLASVAFALVYGLLMVLLREVRLAELRSW